MSLHRSLALLLVGWVSASAQQPVPQPPAANTPAPAAEAPPAVPVPATPTAGQAQPIVPAPTPATPAANQAPAATPAPPAVPVPPRIGPGARPLPGGAVNPAAAAAAKPVVPLGETKIVEDINEPKLSGESLAGLWRIYTGRNVIVTSAAATAEFHFVQPASPEKPLTYSKASELLRIAAQLENFSFVTHPQDPDLDILTLATGGVRPTGVTVDVYNENTPLPETDIVISYVMTLSHIKPDQALNIFTQIIGQFGAYGSIAAVPNASAVVITEKASLIKSLVDLKKTIDVPGSVQSSKFIKVQYADVTEIATTLTDLLTAQQSAQSTSGVQRNTPAPQPGAAPAPAAQAGGGGASSGGGEDTPVQILPEPRTNRIFVMGRPVDILFVEGLVREFDIQTTERTFLRRKLHFLTVSEFLPVAGDALTRAFTGTGDGGASGGAGAAGGGSASGGRTQGGGRSSNTGSSNRGSMSSRGSSSSGFGGSSSGGFGGSSGGFGGGGGGSSFGGGGGGGSALSDPNVNSAPESMLVGRTLLVADNITNSVVAQGPPPALEIIERLLDQIDVKPDQVMISTVIGQMSLNKKLDTGVSYLYRGGDVKGGGGIEFPGFTPGTTTGSSTTNALPALARSALLSGGLRMYGTIDDLDIFLRALQSKTDFTVLSRPSIFTSNNVKGSISSGERIAIPTSTNNYGNSGNSSTNIEYQDVVLKLEVIPLVNSDSEITMEIALLNDEQNGTQTIAGAGSNGDPLTVPKIATRELVTKVTVPNNGTIALGGLIVGRNGKEKSGIPLLSDIPYVGALFGSNADTNDRSELMVFMQPTIVKGSNSLNEVQTDMDSRYKITPQIQNFANNGVLPSKPESTGKGGTSTPESVSEANTLKPSIRPAHKR